MKRKLLLVALLATFFVFGLLGIGTWMAHQFIYSTISSQLTRQHIVFPTANSDALKKLPAADAAAMRQYAGQTMTNGDQALVYANSLMANDLDRIGQHKSYSDWSKIAQEHPKDEKAASTATSMFKGTTLESWLTLAGYIWLGGTLLLGVAIVSAIIALLALVVFIYCMPFVQKKMKLLRKSESPS